MNVVIVEDEQQNLETLEEILQNHCEQVKITGTASTVSEAVQVIDEVNPDLLLMDINLPDGNSFDILKQIKRKDYKLIFITAFEEYAIKAIKLSALDYIVKPVDPKELIQAIDKAQTAIEEKESNLKIDALLANVNNLSHKKEKIVLKTAESIFILDIQDIIRVESEGSYTRFYTNKGNKILISKTMKDYEDVLTDSGFFRIHKSHIVNMNYLIRFDKSEGGYLVMTDQSKVPVSYRKKEKLLEYINNLDSR